ncbi:RNA 2',3'-cyclic phosphodiesterase [Ramlibacter sp. AN1015]|uniref:RNA 2',3'-cyclic phosphodiesterase n=1 Tax=Ramlibacter sp. AN1015 TaxID=3133428 RepID=UPI0030C218E9
MEPASPPEAERRLFVGLMAPPTVREAVLAWRGQWQWPHRSALSAPAHLHLTLFFLGQTPESRIDALVQALSAVPFEPFTIHLGRPEHWPRGLVVLRPAPQPKLDALHAAVVLALRSAGFDAPEALAWKPHLTLARKAVAARPPAQGLQVDWPVGRFALVWSRLPPSVPRAHYEPIAQWPDAPSA